MKFFFQMLDICHKYLTTRDWDNLTITDGYVGTGKSNLWLHGLEYWQNKVYGECTTDDIKHINLDKKGFVTDLRALKRYEMTIYDEAGDLSNFKQMNKFNYTLSLTYTIIRGLNLYTNLTLPSIFRLNPYFVRDRARFYIRVYERGKIAIWDRPRIVKLIMLNQNRLIKNPFIVKPLAYDNFPLYKGLLLQPYKDKKEQRLESIREQLLKEVTEEIKRDKVAEAMYKLNKDKGLTQKEIGELFDCTQANVSKKIKLITA